MLATLATIAMPAGASAQEPTCLTYKAPDGHEPICNPWLMDSSWEQGHRNPYSQHTSPIAGPRPDEDVESRYYTFEEQPAPGVTLGAFFSPPYPDGKRVAWTLTVTGQNDNPIAKFDLETGRRLGFYTHATSGDGLPSERAALSGIYILSDRNGNIIQPRGQWFEAYGDDRVREGPIRSIAQFELPARARCGDGDRLVGLTMLWNGRMGFVTQRAMVGTFPSDHREWKDENLLVTSINPPEACARADESEEGLETVSNSLSGDERGGMYPVTNRAQYRFDVRGGQVVQTWRVAYKTGTSSSVRQDDGSGSTPALMGTDPDDDRFVAITDGAPLTNLVLLWRDEIPAGWEGLPGRDRRIACEHPLRFGDESVTEAQNEQSVAIRGYAALIPNNELRDVGPLEEAYGPVAQASGLPLQLAVAGELGALPQHQPRGFERVDWDPKTRTCQTVWVNKEVSIPNGVPTMSAGSDMVYGIGVRNGTWGLEGMDFGSGTSKLWVPVSPHPYANSFYAALSIAPDGSMWSGALQGFTVFRPPARPPLERECRDVFRPRASFGDVVSAGRRLQLSGTASDRGCAGVARVEVAVWRHTGRGCAWVRRSGRLGKPGRCQRIAWQPADGTTSWTDRTGRLPRATYFVRVRARDAAGNLRRVVRRQVRLR